MNRRIQLAAQVSNPFKFKHIINLNNKGGAAQLEDVGPCVVMASPGMLQNGLSRQLLEMWAPDAENGLVLTGSVARLAQPGLLICLPPCIHDQHVS